MNAGAQFLQFLFSGLTVGAMYALAAVGYALIYNASHLVNFAQGDFIMLGAMVAAVGVESGLPVVAAIALGIAIPTIVGALMERLAIRPAQGAPHITLLIITLGVGLTIRGAVQVSLGKGNHGLPAFSGDQPIEILGAALSRQSIWVFVVTGIAVAALAWFFNRTRSGKAMLATSHNKLAARLIGVNADAVLMRSFALSGALGALGGVLVAPITFTSSEAGVVLGVKGFAAAAIGGLGSGPGAIAGGVILGILEAFTAGYLSSAYKDVVAYAVILLVLMFMPRGLFAGRSSERV